MYPFNKNTLVKNYFFLIVFALLHTKTNAQISNNKNFVATVELKQPGVKTAAAVGTVPTQSKVTKVEYLDGLGRSEQTVLVNAKEIGVDVIIPKKYDALGRVEKEYLPYALPLTGTGAFRTNWETEQLSFYQNNNPAILPNDLPDNNPFSINIFEPSPLNRVIQTFAPGNVWAGTIGTGNGEVSVKNEFKIYDPSAGDNVRSWELNYSTNPAVPVISSYTYQPGDLAKTKTFDEHGKLVEEYKDKNGNIILKKVQLANIFTVDPHEGWLCTYYVYDDLNRLRYVLPPKTTEYLRNNNWILSQPIINELCFWYEYDDRGRLITKHIPGAEPVNMVYDNRDRLLFTQDGHLYAQSNKFFTKWLMNMYDPLNRPVATAIFNSAIYKTRSDLQDATNNFFITQTTLNLLGDNISISYLPAFLDPSLLDILTVNFYDNYQNSVAANANAVFFSGYTFPYAAGQATASGDYPADATKNVTVTGKLTATKAKILDPTVVLNGKPYLFTVNYFDKEYRILQTAKQNLMGVPYVFEYITNVVTNQYDFNGKLLGYQEVVDPYGVKWSVVTKNELDIEGKITKIYKKVSSLFTTSNEKLIVTNEYDRLGRLRIKTTGTGTICENKQDYTYNIRGWVRGVNLNYLNGNIKPTNQRFFGYELGYNTLTSGGTLPGPQLNGNIGSMSWASAGKAGRDALGTWNPSPNGAGIQRKYDYTYDNTNRLKKADFTELKYNSWINNEKDFSVSGNDNGMMRYDENGNIQSMNQMGVVGTAVQPIDILQYNYLSGGNSNRLMAVTDVVNDPSSTLGDFKELTAGAAATQDYGYDANGNLTVDFNKHINNLGAGFNSPAIKYNYLNLPESIAVITENGNANKGSIKYSYDALGNKYRKTVTDLTTSPNPTITVTNYVNGFMFGGGFGTGLDQIATEEGRIRYAIQPNNTIDYEYDWFIKDHLGNTRMVLTEQPTPSPTFQYKASFEDLPTVKVTREDIAKEKALFGEDVLSPTRNPLPTELKDKDPGNKKCALLKPGNNGKVPYKILKVNAGDKFNIGVQYYYRQQASKVSNKNIREDILNNLLTGILGMGNAATNAAKAGSTLQPNLISSPYSTSNALRRFTDDDNQQQLPGNRPRAYLNYVLMDTAMQFIKGGALRVGEMDAAEPGWKNLVQNDIEATQAGYFLVYISNEEQPTANMNAGNVYFDNLVIITNEGPIMEENHYYPFGLLIHPISTSGSGRLQNKHKFADKELQNNEFTDASGLDWIDFGARMYDAQIGRWHVLDKESEVYFALTPYNYGGNCPVNTVDIDGNLFIFANGFMVNQWMGGQNKTISQPCEWTRGRGGSIPTKWKTVPNPNYYAPDRGFYEKFPRNNGLSFKYWKGVDEAYMKHYNDANAYYTNGSFTPMATANARFKEGELAGQQLLKKLESGDIVLKKDETIKIVGHSQGAAYAAGIASALANNAKYASLVEFVDYLSPHQPGDFKHPSGVYGRQFSTESDQISSKGWKAKTFGYSYYHKIYGANWGIERENYSGGYGGHMVETWLNDLLLYWGEKK